MENLPRFTFNGGVSLGQKQFYDTYGFIIFKGVLSTQEQATILEDAYELEQRTLAGTIPVSDIDDITPVGTMPDGKPLVHRLPYFTRYSPRSRTLIEEKQLLALGRGLIGEQAWLLEDTMHGAIFQQKLAAPQSQYSHIHWHIDFPADHVLGPVVSIGMYLDASTVANGCLLLVPASHRFPPGRFQAPAIPIEVEAGDVVCHADRIYHASTRPTERGAIRRTLYLYICAGTYPGANLPFSSEQTKRSVRTLFTAR